MAKVKELKEKKKGKNSITKKRVNKPNKDSKENMKIYEKSTCFIVGIIDILLLFSVFKSSNFIPAFLIATSLEMFCIAYYYLEDIKKRNVVYGLFIFGVGLIIAALIYTIIKLS